MNYEIRIDQSTGKMYGVILDASGAVVRTSHGTYSEREPVITWIVAAFKIINPDGPCSITRKKVCNERVFNCPGFWEITTYNANGKKLRSGQWSDVFQEGYLAALIQEQLRFPLEAAKEIK